jgi:Methylase involved in ubiquinone/menaquinone biosynthesis
MKTDEFKGVVRGLTRLFSRHGGTGDAPARPGAAGAGVNVEQIKEVVRRRYGEFAASGGVAEACCAAVADESAGFAVEHGLYSGEEMALLPEGAVNLSRGCGNPVGFAGLRAGETVVDFGCGGGIDVILAARKVGADGRVVGVDSAPEMIERARENVAAAGVSDGAVEFREADLAETGLPAGSADVVTSNCVINLCPDKEQVYREAFRLLRPGGRVAISDICLTEELPAELTASFQSMWSGCLGGAMPVKAYFELVGLAGFDEITVVSEHTLEPEELEAMATCPGPGLHARASPAALRRRAGQGHQRQIHRAQAPAVTGVCLPSRAGREPLSRSRPAPGPQPKGGVLGTRAPGSDERDLR